MLALGITKRPNSMSPLSQVVAVDEVVDSCDLLSAMLLSALAERETASRAAPLGVKDERNADAKPTKRKTKS